MSGEVSAEKVIANSVNYLFAYNTSNIGTGVLVDTALLGSTPQLVAVDILTAFDSAATLKVGFSAGGTEWINALDLTAAAGTYDRTFRIGSQTIPLASARAIWVQVTGSPTVGSARLRVLTYI